MEGKKEANEEKEGNEGKEGSEGRGREGREGCQILFFLISCYIWSHVRSAKTHFTKVPGGENLYKHSTHHRTDLLFKTVSAWASYCSCSKGTTITELYPFCFKSQTLI